ncbi:universal stress protein [Nocardia higoensis]|uniref:universal stress protein n=1 Tax=Nocardia higoensis TaxID=228599 RepID=UPI000592E4B6|nr:universal stress protein [Nocardia higoensis]
MTSSESSRAPLVVGVDGSEYALAAVRWAAGEAALGRVPLRLVAAVPVGYDPDSYALEVERHRAAECIATARGIAVEAVGNGDLDIDGEVVEQAPVPMLLARSRTARMIVTGTSGMGAIRRAVLGSVSTSVARHAQCPVAIVPLGGAEIGRRVGAPVVVGVDGSECSMRAVAIAFESACLHRVGLVAVLTWTGLGYLPRADLQAEAEALLSQSLAGFAEKYPDVVVHRVVEEARPAERLLAASEHARLLVVGSHGRNGFTGMTLGSVGQKVLHATEIPLIIARPGGPGPE